MVKDIVYGKGWSVNKDSNNWALEQLDEITNTRPRSTAFTRYMIDN